MTTVSCLKEIDFSKLSELEGVLEQCNPKITFWGGRVIEAVGTKGSIYLDAVVKKVHDAARARCDADDLKISERMIGLRIVRKLDAWDRYVSEQVRELNFITRLFYKIRNFSFTYIPRFYLGEMARLYFRAFSEKKITEQVGNFVCHDEGKMQGYSTHPDSDMSFISPPRWCVKEEKIAELASRYTETS